MHSNAAGTTCTDERHLLQNLMHATEGFLQCFPVRDSSLPDKSLPNIKFAHTEEVLCNNLQQQGIEAEVPKLTLSEMQLQFWSVYTFA